VRVQRPGSGPSRAHPERAGDGGRETGAVQVRGPSFGGIVICQIIIGPLT
jgi:hypothetical protein